MNPHLVQRLAKELAKPLATLLVRTAFGNVAGTMAGGLLNIVERATTDYLDQQELVRQFDRISEKIVECLTPTFQKAVDDGNVDVEKVAVAMAAVLGREASAATLLAHHMQPEVVAATWTKEYPDRWNDFNSDERELYDITGPDITGPDRQLIDGAWAT